MTAPRIYDVTGKSTKTLQNFKYLKRTTNYEYLKWYSEVDGATQGMREKESPLAM
jgi:hypothetical protein